MNVVIKPMETDEETRGKAFVHWRCWQEDYRGLVSDAYREALTLAECERRAFRWRDGLLVAKDGERVVGFVGYGDRGEEAPGLGEVFAMYVLAEYRGTGVAQRLMEAALDALRAYPRVVLWVLRDNPRAIRFYEKCGFQPDGEQLYSKAIAAWEIRMSWTGAECNGLGRALEDAK